MPVTTPVNPTKPTRLTITNAFEINRREQDVDTCLGTTCHGSSCSQTSIYSLWLLIDFSCVYCSLSCWLPSDLIYQLNSCSDKQAARCCWVSMKKSLDSLVDLGLNGSSREVQSISAVIQRKVGNGELGRGCGREKEDIDDSEKKYFFALVASTEATALLFSSTHKLVSPPDPTTQIYRDKA